MARKTLTDLRANPRKLTPEESARLGALTDEEMTRAAENDPDNPPLTSKELDRLTGAQAVRRVRERTRLTQREFAERYCFNLGRLRDLEQGRTEPDSALRAYLKVIEQEPTLVERIVSTT
ncbi:helix-turn-helix domain-containing protein [Microvirga sp. M2]|uniref:helix-turn-helix domain-containing protein n=1 Tax=Microvirga sp. M2 TaxID=3073270 RepID=UPI0039C4A812